MPRTNSSLPYFTRRSRQSQSIRLHIRTIFCFPNILEETFSDSLPNTHGVWHHGYWLLGTILHATSKEVKCPPYRINIRFFFILLSVVLTYLYLACTVHTLYFSPSPGSPSTYHGTQTPHVGWDFLGFRTCIIYSLIPMLQCTAIQ